MRTTATRAILLALLTLAGLVATGLPAAAQEAERAASCGYPDSSDYRVVQGDTLYSIARCTLGDGSRYQEIFELNRGRRQSDGSSLQDPGILHVGWLLELPPEDGPATPPDDGEEPDPDDSPGSGRTYTVRAGDTLSGIAQSQLGDATRYDEIYEINRGRPQVGGGSLQDPGRLTVGWVLELPAANGGGGGGSNPPPTSGGRRYTVAAGDNLSSIAEEQLGDADRYLEIFELNEGVRQADGGRLTDPSVLRVGWVLRLPGNGGGGGGQPDEPATYQQYTVVAGDSLSSIARGELGDASRYQEIFDLNVGRPQAVGGTLSNPSVLRVGWVLRLPADVE